MGAGGGGRGSVPLHTAPQPRNLFGNIFFLAQNKIDPGGGPRDKARGEHGGNPGGGGVGSHAGGLSCCTKLTVLYNIDIEAKYSGKKLHYPLWEENPGQRLH